MKDIFYIVSSTICWLIFIFALIFSCCKQSEYIMLYALLFYLMYMKLDLEGKIN